MKRRLLALAVTVTALAGCSPGDRLLQVDLTTGRFVSLPAGSTTPQHGCLDGYVCDDGTVATFSVNDGWWYPEAGSDAYEIPGAVP